MILELPFPAKELFPNSRAHRLAQARVIRKHREIAFFATLTAMGVRKVPKRITYKDAKVLGVTDAGRNSTFYQKLSRLFHPAEPPVVTGYSLTFQRPSVRYDDDNCNAAFKAYRDGIADALRMNDNQLRQTAPSVMELNRSKAAVRVELND